MPYKTVSNHPQCPASKPWGVVKETDGQLMGCHESKTKAASQIAALNIAEASKVEKATKLDQMDAAMRQRSLRQSVLDLATVLDNSDGWRRLRRISDEEWQAAVEADERKEVQLSDA